MMYYSLNIKQVEDMMKKDMETFDMNRNCLSQSHNSYRKDENRTIFGFFIKMYNNKTH